MKTIITLLSVYYMYLKMQQQTCTGKGALSAGGPDLPMKVKGPQ
jgi:hypothetical protein